MSSDNGSASPVGNQGEMASEEKQRLSETQKKANHIASEQKRRTQIRAGFDRLTEIVPGIEGMGRSEGHVLTKTIEYMQEQLETRQKLVDELEKRGVKVDDADKLPLIQAQQLEEQWIADHGDGSDGKE